MVTTAQVNSFIGEISPIIQNVVKYSLTQFDNALKESTGSSTASSNNEITLDSITTDKNPFNEPTATVQYGTKGESAKWVQWCLWRFGLLEKTGIDGIIGNQSVTAIKEAQKRSDFKQTEKYLQIFFKILLIILIIYVTLII